MEADYETLRLIIALQQEDVDNHLSANRLQDSPNGGEKSLAFELYGEELAIQQRILSDTRMARSVNQLEIARETQTNEDEGIAKILNALINVSLEERKRVLGDALSSKVEVYQPELVANITDMLLEMMLREMNHLEILSLFNDDESLRTKIGEVRRLYGEAEEFRGEPDATEGQEGAVQSREAVEYGAEEAGLSDTTTAEQRATTVLERNSEGSANPRKRSLEEDKNEEQEGEDDEQSEEEGDDEESDEDGIVLAGLENDTIRLARHRKSRNSIPKPNMPF